MIEGHQGVITSVCWSRNGRCLVTGGMDKTIRLWEFVNGQAIAKFEGHQGKVSGVAFPGPGRTVASASRDTTILVWDATLGSSLQSERLEVAMMNRLWDEFGFR